MSTLHGTEMFAFQIPFGICNTLWCYMTVGFLWFFLVQQSYPNINKWIELKLLEWNLLHFIYDEKQATTVCVHSYGMVLVAQTKTSS